MEKRNNYEKRKEKRNNLLLKTIKSLVDKNNKNPVATIDIHKRIYNKGYEFSFETLYRDLIKLERAKKITKKLVHCGKGYGTKNLWNLSQKQNEQ